MMSISLNSVGIANPTISSSVLAGINANIQSNAARIDTTATKADDNFDRALLNAMRI